MIEQSKKYWFMYLWILLCISIIIGGGYFVISLEINNKQCKVSCITKGFDNGQSLHSIYDGNCKCEKYPDNVIKGSWEP